MIYLSQAQFNHAIANGIYTNVQNNGNNSYTVTYIHPSLRCDLNRIEKIKISK